MYLIYTDYRPMAYNLTVKKKPNDEICSKAFTKMGLSEERKRMYERLCEIDKKVQRKEILTPELKIEGEILRHQYMASGKVNLVRI